MTQPDEQAAPRYPLYDAKADYSGDDTVPLYAERFCACGGILRIRARAFQMPGALEGFEARHGKPACKPIGKADWPAAREAEQRRGHTQAALNDAIAEGLAGDDLTKKVAAAEKSFKPRTAAHFDADASPED